MILWCLCDKLVFKVAPRKVTYLEQLGVVIRCDSGLLRVKLIVWVLPVSMNNWLLVNQLFILKNQKYLHLLHVSWIVSLKNCDSLVNNIILLPLDSMLAKLFTWTSYRMGPRTDHWGTPAWMASFFKDCYLQHTNCVLSER